MTTEGPTRFEALYRIERDGTHTWLLQLEDDQMVTVTQEEVRLYATRDSIKNGDDPLGVIARKVKEDDPEGKVSEGSKRLF